MKNAITSALALTSCTDVEIIVHNENNMLLTLQDEAGDARVIQFRKYDDNDFTACDSYADGEYFHYDFSSVEELGETLKSLVII